MSLFKTYILLSALAVLAFLISCGGEEPDPCAGLEPFTASFKMGIHFSGGSGEWEIDTLIASDTVINKKFITFLADKEYDSYAWSIGNDPRVFTEQRVSLLFTVPEDRLKVQLIAKKQPNSACFPTDDGIDTVVHYLTIIAREDNPILGTYTGYLESDPNTEMEVEIIFDADLYGYQINNINKGCYPVENYKSGVDHLATYKVIYFAENLTPGDYAYPNECMDPRGWVILDSLSKSIIIPFSQGARETTPPYAILPDIRTYDVFNGIKIN